MPPMWHCAVKVIGHERATGTTFLPIGPEHEVIDHQLTAAVEEIGQRFFAFGSVEDVILLDFQPRKLASFGAELIASVGEGFFLFQEIFSRSKPFFLRCE